MTKRLWIGAGLVAAIALSLHWYALWSREYVPLVDLPNHMARHAVEADYWAGDELPPFYEVRYRILPNLGGDLTIPFLMQVFDPLTACRVFLTLSVLLYWFGPVLFFYQISESYASAVLASLLWLPFLFSSQFLWGFINYYSGFGLAFLALAHFNWMWSRQRFAPIHGVLHAALVALLFLWHLAPWGIYGVIMGCRVLIDILKDRKLIKAAAYLSLTIPSLVLFAIYFVSREGAEQMTYNWGGVVRKLLMPITLFRTYQLSIDGGTAIAWFIVIVACFQLRSLLANAKGWLVFAFIVLAVFYLLIPFQLGSTSDTDTRLLPAMLVCALGLLACVPVRRLAIGLVVLGVCVAARVGGVVVAWDRIGSRLDDQVQALTHVEENGRIFPVVLLPTQSKEYPDEHFVMWSVVFEDTFVPTMFTYADQQPISFRKPYRECAELDVRRTGSGAYTMDAAKLKACYDYVWVFNPENHTVRLPKSCEVIFTRRATMLYRISP